MALPKARLFLAASGPWALVSPQVDTAGEPLERRNQKMNNPTNKKPTETNKPIHKIRLGSISVTIWENASDNGKTSYRAVLVKSYRDQKGTWQETGTFRVDDLILVSTVAQRAADWMLDRENES
jgi:hypothetical protein